MVQETGSFGKDATRRVAPRVLLVEDERAVEQALVECLEQIGCEVVTAANLGGAMTLARDERELFDVAILDLELPDGNGLELVEALRARQQPCVSLVLTGHEEVEWARRAATLGVAGFLRKPVSARQLSSEVAKAIDRSREMRAWLTGEGARGSAGAEVVAEAIVADLDTPMERPVRSPADQVLRLSREFGLTTRQTEALTHVSEGCRDREIAELMGVSYSRVRQLLGAGFAKLGVKSRNDFIRFLSERQGRD